MQVSATMARVRRAHSGHGLAHLGHDLAHGVAHIGHGRADAGHDANSIELRT